MRKEAPRWLMALSASKALVVCGYLSVWRKGKWKRRWAVYHRGSHHLALYRSQADWTGGEADGGQCRGHGKVESAIARPSPAKPYAFACYAPDGGMWELSAVGKEEHRRWLSALPRWRRPSLLEGLEAGGGSGPGHVASVGGGGLSTPLTLASYRGGSSQNVALRALRTELEQLKAKMAGGGGDGRAGAHIVSGEARCAATATTATSKRRGPAGGGAGGGGTSGGGGAGGAAAQGSGSARSSAPDARGSMGEEGGSVEENEAIELVIEDDGDEEEDDTEEDLGPARESAGARPPVLSVGLSVHDLETHAKPIAHDHSREALRAMVKATAAGGGAAAGSGAAAAGGGDGLMAALLEELAELRQENMSLKVKVGGSISASEDEALLSSFLELLQEVLAMRAARRFEQELFDRYNGALVQLSDEHVREMYGCFMMVYVDEATEEVS